GGSCDDYGRREEPRQEKILPGGEPRRKGNRCLFPVPERCVSGPIGLTMAGRGLSHPHFGEAAWVAAATAASALSGSRARSASTARPMVKSLRSPGSLLEHHAPGRYKGGLVTNLVRESPGGGNRLFVRLPRKLGRARDAGGLDASPRQVIA